MSLIPEDYLDILQSTALAYMATIGPKGEPQVSPVWFGWDGIHLLVSMTKVRQKHRNLLHDPRIAIAIADPANPCRSLEIRGEARIEEDVNYRFNAVVTKKYTGQEYTEQTLIPISNRVRSE
jgi:PPOX class probable F420-dependent enzyme